MKGMKLILLVMLISFIIAGAWDKVEIIKKPVHFILNPSFGSLLNWDLLWGMVIIIIIINILLTIIHKYTTDQEALKALKVDQKKLQAEMKELKGQPAKMMELQKQQMAQIPKSFEHVMKPLIYTAIPIILFFRWFNDYFVAIDSPKIFIGLGWFGTYLIFSIIASIALRKILRVH